jgi:competence protein ComGC
MVFSDIFQLKFKKLWWVDIIFYFAISALVATLFCYGIFLVKNNLQKKEISKIQIEISQFGSNQQKEHEKYVLNYQSKIRDFSNLLKNHRFASNVFAFMRGQTRPNIWFKQFGLTKSSNQVQFTGEAEDMNALARQVSAFETNKYVKSISAISSAVGFLSKIDFNFSITLDDSVFGYEYFVQENQTESPEENPQNQVFQQQEERSSEKAILTFSLTNPDIAGVIDENRNIALEVPFGTDITNLTPLITVSSNAVVLPASDVPQNFSNDVLYTVTAQDGSYQSYIAKVRILQEVVSANTPENNNRKSSNVFLISAIVVLMIIGVVVLAIIIIKRIKRLHGN